MLSGSRMLGITVMSAVHCSSSTGNLCLCAGELLQEQPHAAGCAEADRENLRWQPRRSGSTCQVHPVSQLIFAIPYSMVLAASSHVL